MFCVNIAYWSKLNNMPEKFKYICLGDWLELGQAMNDLSNIERRWFSKYDTQEICIGGKIKIKAGGKTFKAGRYKLLPYMHSNG